MKFVPVMIMASLKTKEALQKTKTIIILRTDMAKGG
jgi:hypothetical protein